MKLWLINFHRQLSFLLILFLGFSYLSFLGIFTQKIYSGFLMQLIFILDALVTGPSSLVDLITRSDFLIQMTFGLAWLSLIMILIKSIFQLINQIHHTSVYINSLKIINTNPNYSIFSSSSPQIFTAGFFYPRIFLSRQILKISSPDELSAMLCHEQSHCSNFDPLKNLFVSFTTSIIPYFPGKNWLFGQYQTLVEISCDNYSQAITHHPKSLISALIKVQEVSLAPVGIISRFSAQSERIKILVGQKTLALRSVFATNLVMVAILIFTTSFISRSTLFYQCQHLVKCFANVFVEDHLSLETVNNLHQCNFQ